MGEPLHILEPGCPLFGPDGKLAPQDMDSAVEDDFNQILKLTTKVQPWELVQVEADAAPCIYGKTCYVKENKPLAVTTELNSENDPNQNVPTGDNESQIVDAKRETQEGNDMELESKQANLLEVKSELNEEVKTETLDQKHDFSLALESFYKDLDGGQQDQGQLTEKQQVQVKPEENKNLSASLDAFYAGIEGTEPNQKDTESLMYITTNKATDTPTQNGTELEKPLNTETENKELKEDQQAQEAQTNDNGERRGKKSRASPGLETEPSAKKKKLTLSFDKKSNPHIDTKLFDRCSLGRAMDIVLHNNNNVYSDQEKHLLNWHVANLEYGCAAELADISLKHWDQVGSSSLN